MTTSEILQKIDIPRHKLYYLELKRYVVPERISKGDLESREYSPQDLAKIRLIWKYLKRGFKHKVAYQKALEKLNSDALDQS
jgi:DNA-binding transcriptional MerR regulator